MTNGAYIDFKTEPLYELPTGCTLDATTADGHGLAFVEREDGRLQAFWDGHGGAPFEGFAELRDDSSAITVSDDGKHVAFVGSRDGQFFVARDGDEDPPFHAFTRSVAPVFSHGGGHLAYGAGQVPSQSSVPGGQPDFRLILDGRAISAGPVAPIQAVFSPSGDRLAFVEIREEPHAKAEYRVVIDGVPGPWFIGMRNAMAAMRFSPDGQRFALYRIDGSGRAQWVVDGRPQRWSDDVRPLSLAMLRGVGAVEPELLAAFSPDSRRFAYFADVEGKGVAIVEDDVEGPRFKFVGEPVFSPDSKRLAYTAGTSSEDVRLVVDGQAGQAWRAVRAGPPVFSPDSRHIAVLFRREEGRFFHKRGVVGCVVDGRVLAEKPGDAYFAQPVFSPDSAHVAWWYGHDERISMMLDDVPFPTDHRAYSAAVFTSAGHLVHAVEVGPSGHQTMTVEGRLGPFASFMLPNFTAQGVFVCLRTGDPWLPFAVSEDGEHVAWAGLFGDEARPVVDDEVGPAFEWVFSTRFDTPESATWLAQRASTVYRVTASAVKSGGRSG